MDITDLVDSLREEFNNLIELIVTGKPSPDVSMKHRIHLLKSKLYDLEKKFDEMEDKDDREL